ncbi:hypothetical protein EDB84DRAFT_1443803 [Lactarius hengduanensis]|nr:hypothetical protein EDB84DRAFT_1443803 [Lactarius hengduanensis]
MIVKTWAESKSKNQDRRECVTSDSLHPLAWPPISADLGDSVQLLLQITILHTASKYSFTLHLGGLASDLSVPFTPHDSLFLLLASCRPSCVGGRPSKLHFRRSQGRPSSKAFSHISSVPGPRSPGRSPSLPSSDIRSPSGLGRRGSIIIISELDMAYADSPVSPTFPRMSELFPSVLTYVVPPSARSSFQTHPTRARTLSSPAFLHSPTESTHAPPPPPQRIIVTSPQRFGAAAQLALYRTLELSADDADACVARLAGAPHLAALVTTLTLRAYLPAHGPSFVLALALALRSMRALSALTLPAFDAELLSAAPGTLTHLTLLADTFPYAFFDGFLAAPARVRLTHLALPHFVGVPPTAQDVPSAAVPRLAVLDSSPGLAAALAPGRPLRRVTLHIASTLYDGLRPAALFGALGGALKELGLVLAPDVDVRTRGRLLSALGNTGAGLEVLSSHSSAHFRLVPEEELEFVTSLSPLGALSSIASMY